MRNQTMPGGYAFGFHEGSRSEILADYLFSAWGSVTPVRRTDDTGTDLYCTLMERRGALAVVTDYYSAQIKSDADPWVFDDAVAVNWLVDYPQPLFLGCVDKSSSTLSVYQTMARFLGGFWARDRLELIPSSGDTGQCAQYTDPEKFDISVPILQVRLDDFSSKERLKHFEEVMKLWVRADQKNCIMRRNGLLRFRMPYRYKTNEIPEFSAISEQGNQTPTPEQLFLAIRWMIETVDCVCDQLRHQGDAPSMAFGALLLNHIRQAYPQAYKGDPVWDREQPWSLEQRVSLDMLRALDPGGTQSWVLEQFGKVMSEVYNKSTLLGRFFRTSEEAQEARHKTAWQRHEQEDSPPSADIPP
jgi:hypothetical protein